MADNATIEIESNENNSCNELPQKKLKRDLDVEEDHGGDGGVECGASILSAFKTTRVLRESAREKTIFVHGKLEDQEAVVILEKTPISEDSLSELFTHSRMKLDMKNDIYSTYQLQPPAHLNKIKTTVVCPATEKHVKKYQSQEIFLVKETEDDYNNITLPYIQQQSFSIQWVFNILEKKAEADRIVYEDPNPQLGFVLLPDFKWDQKQNDNLYLIAIAHQRGIKSLRDLTPEHVPLLQNILKKGEETIMERYGLPAWKLRVYIHYQPSYYHLHVHFTALEYDAPGCDVTRAHLIQNVIQNLQLYPQYYRTQTLCFTCRVDDGLLSRFKEAGRL